MNKSQALKWQGKTLRLRPIAIRMTAEGQRVSQDDDRWLVSDVTDTHARIVNQRTDHVWDLGLDNVREFRTPDFLLLRCQLTLRGTAVLSEPVIVTSVDRNITGFETLLKHSWVHESIGTREVWISEVDNMFQIELGDKDRHFSEPWTQRFPDCYTSSAYPVFLKVQGVEIKELTFISCDGGRILVPMPTIKMAGDERHFCYERSSLEYKVGQVIGRWYIHGTLDGVAGFACIDLM